MAILAPMLIQAQDGSERRTTSYDRLPESPCYLLAVGDPLVVRSQQWRDARFLMFEVAYQAPHHIRLQLRFFEECDSEARLSITYGFIPGLPARLAFDLRHLKAQILFLPRSPGILKATCLGNRVDQAAIDRLEIHLLDSAESQLAFVAPPRLATDQPFCPVRKLVLVDELGQLMQRQWSGRIESTAQLTDLLHKEVDSPDRPLPREWSAYGGNRQLRFDATGWFRTHHDGERWWLVDPDGYAFFSTGVDCVVPGSPAAIVPGTEDLYAWLPKRREEFGEHLSSHAGWSVPTVDFPACNLQRVFGGDWAETWQRLTRRRLQRWRFNTIGNWSQREFCKQAAIPYVINLFNYPTTTTRLYRDLPDVFDPAFEQASAHFAEQLEAYVDDRTMLGYFMANEPKWAFGSADLASEMLEDHPGSHSRRALVEHLRASYRDDAAAWARAWGLPAGTGFDSLVDRTWHRLADTHPGAREDLDAFSRLLARRFAEVPAAALKRVDPHHLNLGLRFAWISSPLCLEAAAAFDVFSLNCYEMLPDTAAVEQVVQACDRPVLIGEYHFGALDAGLLGTGLRGVESQVERGIAFRNYLEACAAHPGIVGCHYFQWNDQPGLGRFDGECWQIGFVDVCQQPYRELVHAATLSNERIYKVRTGKVEPFRHDVREVPKIAF